MRLRKLYPSIRPFKTGRLRVSKLHSVYYEECGNPRGKPVVFLHGGPGGGCSPVNRRYFNPKKYRIVLFDQRGCGRSRPHAELRENSTWDLVADIERIREHLGIDRWVVFGGSWGSTLSLAYAQTHPDRTKGLILRGIFLGTKWETKWLFQDGASRIFPDKWENYVKPIPPRERKDFVKAYHKRLNHRDAKIRNAAARAWTVWEAWNCALIPNMDYVRMAGKSKYALQVARLENHYFVNKCFFRKDTQLLDDVHKIRKIPGIIVHGRYDVVCPMDAAWKLYRAWPQARLAIVRTAGHTMVEPGIRHALLEETDRFASL